MGHHLLHPNFSGKKLIISVDLGQRRFHSHISGWIFPGLLLTKIQIEKCILKMILLTLLLSLINKKLLNLFKMDKILTFLKKIKKSM